MNIEAKPGKPQKSLLEQAKMARQIMPEHGPVMVNHTGKKEEWMDFDPMKVISPFIHGFGDYVHLNHPVKKGPTPFTPVREFMTRAGVPENKVNVVYDANSHYKGIKKARQDFYSMDVAEARRFLRRRSSAEYALNNPSLDASLALKMNRHGAKDHIDPMHDLAAQRMEESGFTHEEKLITTAIIERHDTGNKESRSAHNWLSVRQAEKRLPELRIQGKEKQWREIRRGIILHNEPAVKGMISGWEKAAGRPLTDAEVIDLMRQHFGRPTLMGIELDKARIGRERISNQARDIYFLENDIHLEINLLGKTAYQGLSPDKKRYTWVLQYDPAIHHNIDRKQMVFKGQKMLDGRWRAHITKKTQAQHEATGHSYADIWFNQLWNVNKERFILMIRAVFANHPQLEEFKVVLEDCETGADPKEIVFRPDSISDTVSQMLEQYSKVKEKAVA